jgi:outer membrane protein TolC
MKKLLALFLFLCIINAYGQEIDYNSIVLPSTARDVSIEEKLVQLAWKNPNSKILVKNVEIAEYELRQSKLSWLDHLRAQGNLNEFTIKDLASNDTNDPAVNRASFYPKYNISLSFSLGDFFIKPVETKRRRELVEVAQESANAQKIAIRAETLRRYNAYLLAKNILEVQTSMEQDSYANFKLVQDRFKNGEENIQSYNLILERYTNQRLKKMEVEMDYKNAKLNVEEMIGMKLENVTGK